MDLRIPLPAIIQHYMKSDETLWARIVSFVFSPPLIWAGWVFPLSFYVSSSTTEALMYATIFTLGVCWIPVSFVVLMMKLGKISDLYMLESRERYIPYAISIIGNLTALILLTQLNAPPTLLIVTLISCVQLILILVGTFFEHISTHTMAVTSVTTLTALIFGVKISLFFLPFILLAVLARLVLNRHNARQIILGALIGTVPPLFVIVLLAMVI